MISESKQINDVDDFNGYASDLWETFLRSFTKENKLIREVDEDDTVEEHWQFVYTDRGMVLADRMRKRLYKVGEKHFPNDEIEIDAGSYYQEL